MVRLLLGFLLTVLPALPAPAQQVVADLSQTRVSIDATFTGSEILIFGAIKRDGPAEADDLDVIVTVQGPLRPITVRRKERVAGIWVNTDAVEIDAAPSFYAVATTGPLTAIVSEAEDMRHRISIPQKIRIAGLNGEVPPAEPFAEALIRIRSRVGAYQLRPGGVTLREGTLFSTRIELPANLVEGDYATRILLTRNRDVVSSYETVLNVRKVGLERFLFTLAHDRPFLYGLMALAIAIAAGWTASFVFRLLRR